MATYLKATQLGTSGARTMPGRNYTSPEVFAKEMERIYQRRWLCAGRASEVAKAGDFIVREVGAESIIVTRDASGELHAFYNVCRHRGTRMCEAASGNLGETIVCPYHAWTYTLDGQCIGAPHMSGVEGFDKKDHALHEAAVGEWEGFVFINLGRDPEPLDEAFATLTKSVARFRMAELRLHRRIEYDIAANWKLIHQNYSECYHCSPVHPQLVKLTPPTSGENDLWEGPFLGGFMEITAPGGSLTVSGRMCGLPITDVPADAKQKAWYYSVFPNMFISVLPEYLLTFTLWPQGPGRTKLVADWAFHPETLASGRHDPDDAVNFWDEVNKQDWHVSELTQLGVASKTYAPGPYSPREGLSVQFDREVRRALGEE
ncbi:MAG TPA: aromatic ring-hydroxylating dioxygenase subunit alpha [Gemmatimonadaceae bacterium]|nr:aromatic ring-hydroxylating dioxygenase subunit alpha [Gemmatimonadaceae bacterium]